jgi:hypothetical protein
VEGVWWQVGYILLPLFGHRTTVWLLLQLTGGGQAWALVGASPWFYSGEHHDFAAHMLKCGFAFGFSFSLVQCFGVGWGLVWRGDAVCACHVHVIAVTEACLGRSRLAGPPPAHCNLAAKRRATTVLGARSSCSAGPVLPGSAAPLPSRARERGGVPNARSQGEAVRVVGHRVGSSNFSSRVSKKGCPGGLCRPSICTSPIAAVSAAHCHLHPRSLARCEGGGVLLCHFNAAGRGDIILLESGRQLAGCGMEVHQDSVPRPSHHLTTLRLVSPYHLKTLTFCALTSFCRSPRTLGPNQQHNQSPWLSARTRS